MKKTLLLRALALLLVLCMTAAFAGCGALNAYVEIKDAVDTLNGTDAPDVPDKPDVPVSSDKPDTPDKPDASDAPEDPAPTEPEEDPEPGEPTAADSLAELRAGIADTGCIAAIAYIGGIEGPMGDG